MIKHYILDGHNAVPVDMLTWARSFSECDRTVARETVCGCEVSTVFLGLDHGFGSGPPMIFETMVFGGPLDQEQERYSTWDEAEAGHQAMVGRVRAEARVKELESFIVALWDEFGVGGDIDGGWLQDEMEKRGLIVPHVVTEDEYDEESEFGPGDTVYRLSPTFERTLRGEER
jgi:hypothetical protein